MAEFAEKDAFLQSIETQINDFKVLGKTQAAERLEIKLALIKVRGYSNMHCSIPGVVQVFVASVTAILCFCSGHSLYFDKNFMYARMYMYAFRQDHSRLSLM